MNLPNFSGHRALVTGGAGFIGSHLTHALVAAGADVLVLDNFSHGTHENLADLAGKIEIHQGDIRDPQACARAVHGRHFRFFTSRHWVPSRPPSKNPILYNEVNIGEPSTYSKPRAQARVKRVVYSASSAAYGDTPYCPKSNPWPPAPKSPYAVTKLVGEYYCRVYADVYQLSTCCLRYFNVFGPRQNPKSQYAAVIPAFLSPCARDACRRSTAMGADAGLLLCGQCGAGEHAGGGVRQGTGGGAADICVWGTDEFERDVMPDAGDLGDTCGGAV